MKKNLPLLLILSALTFTASAQTTNLTAAQQVLTDSLCNCVSKLDMSKINTKQQALQEYTGCIGQNLPLLQNVAQEKGYDMNNIEQMRTLGIEIAQILAKQKCSSFLKLSLLLAEKAAKNEISGGITAGTFKRFDVKGFNYVVLSENGSEKSFIWYKQFPGSEELMKPASALVGKKISLNWVDVEVYLPAAKGYYKVKEITGISIK
ncbi:hypothetical protein LT679_14785 [Mucilaginibacter roseus]|uniref:DUF3347 domain-containing protein n=1 Tax=Mucilaginibacter roseus TaxID=1528868 RepID=A0ABS8U7J2_9SPHI|nr:hypothetical protein [Mucilaginibacter roseus]MCD8741879.1 hypothetical protein [Mucilaginibacter roseus]